MNAKPFLFVAALLAAPVLPAQDQRLSSADLPPAVQRALRETSKGDPVKSINRQVIDGRTVYDVELERNNAINPRFRIAEDGTVTVGSVRSVPNPALDPALPGGETMAVTFDPMIPLEELPAPVRETIRKEAAGRPVADIDRETSQGRIVYEVEFKASGLNPQIHIAEDGTIVKAEQRPGSAVGTSIRNLFLGTQLEDTPTAVQETIRREVRSGVIKDIDVERRSGQRIYEVEISDGGRTHQIHVSEDGRLLHNTRPATGALPAG